MGVGRAVGELGWQLVEISNPAKAEILVAISAPPAPPSKLSSRAVYKTVCHAIFDFLPLPPFVKISDPSKIRHTFVGAET